MEYAPDFASEAVMVQDRDVDVSSVVRELRGLRSGVTDTSTLIYLDRLRVLPLASRCLSLLVIPQVIAEYGGQPEGLVPVAACGDGTTDQILCRTAHHLGQAVFSEDKQVLRQARRDQRPYYNSLMLILALCAQGQLDLDGYRRYRSALADFAHYGPGIYALGDAVNGVLRQQADDGVARSERRTG